MLRISHSPNFSRSFPGRKKTMVRNRCKRFVRSLTPSSPLPLPLSLSRPLTRPTTRERPCSSRRERYAPRVSKRAAQITRYALRLVLITRLGSRRVIYATAGLCSFVPAHAAINIDYRDTAPRVYRAINLSKVCYSSPPSVTRRAQIVCNTRRILRRGYAK